jgi:F0F1-type ATP synthase assembly protein I
MEPASRPNFQLAGAGGTLLGTTAACIVLGALVGWAAGSTGIGILIGAVIGIPAGIFTVYRRYNI